jgi:hypothetical protein
MEDKIRLAIPTPKSDVQTMKMNRQWPELQVQEHGRFFADHRTGFLRFKVGPPRIVARVVAKFHATCGFVVPIGYQDKTGFHYGEMSPPGQAAQR